MDLPVCFVAALALKAMGDSLFIFQCAMCKTGAEAGGEASLAQGLSWGILVLLVPPVLIFCAFFWLAYKSRHGPE